MQGKPTKWLTLFTLVAASASAFAQAQTAPAKQEPAFRAGQSVYVLTVKTAAPRDPSVWRQLNRNYFKGNPPPPMHSGTLPPNSSSDDRVTLEKAPTERVTLEKAPTERTSLERTTLERTAPTRRVLPPGDPILKQRIEDEIRRQKKFSLADSPEKADLVILAHGEYIYLETMREGTTYGTIGLIGSGDENLDLNTLVKLKLGAIPAAAYHQWQSDVSQLLTAAKWQTEAWGEFRRERDKSPYEEPPLKKLIEQFHKEAVQK